MPDVDSRDKGGMVHPHVVVMLRQNRDVRVQCFRAEELAGFKLIKAGPSCAGIDVAFWVSGASVWSPCEVSPICEV
jgi:hypothetical protein